MNWERFENHEDEVYIISRSHASVLIDNNKKLVVCYLLTSFVLGDLAILRCLLLVYTSMHEFYTVVHNMKRK